MRKTCPLSRFLDFKSTSETVVVDVEIQYQRHRVLRVRKVGIQFNVPTIPTPDFRHLLCFHFVCCVEKFNELVNIPDLSQPTLTVNRSRS
jgi:hypothetical protein